MQPVSELNQNDPQILGHRHKELAEILGLFGLPAGELQIGQFGDAIHQFGHLFAKTACHLFIRGLGVFDGVMQQRSDNGGIIQALFSQQSGDSHGMRKIGLAGVAELTLMHLFTIGKGLGDFFGIRFRIVVADQSNQVFW